MPVYSGNLPTALLVKGSIRKWWGIGYKEKAPVAPAVFQIETSERAYEDDQQVVGPGEIPEAAEGSTLVYGSVVEGYRKRYTHTTFRQALLFTEELMDDDQVGIVPRLGKKLGSAANYTFEMRCANVLNRMTNSSYLGADGKVLVATDHPLQGGGTFSNKLATNADLDDVSLEEMLWQIAETNDDNGIRIGMTGVKLVGSERMRVTIEELMNSPEAPGTANRAINVFYKRLKPVIWSLLTDADAWGVVTDCDDGLKAYWRKKWRMATDGDFETGGMKMKITGRFSTGWTDPRGYFASTGQGS